MLSLVLRHKPQVLGIELDQNGWVDVDVLLAACHKRGKHLTRDFLDQIVHTNDKKRFAYSPDKRRIRANQGHSVDIDLALHPSEPPDILYHGTSTRTLPVILREGLRPMSRQHVHLSSAIDTAINVGKRHGQPVVLAVDAAKMRELGHLFWISDNGVWLTKQVPTNCLQVLDR